MWVAAYCRVSTDSGDQANSFTAQQRYFREYITRQPDWQLWEIYADEGITGTSTRRREAFARMMRHAREGKFQLLLTKEVSRFSRNILDTIAYTRELRALGVGVLFMNDGIDTRDADAELRLSILGSIAQEESRRTSQRVKWGQKRQMERGVVFGRSLLGYEVRDGQLFPEPQGAAIVRLIFRKYGMEGKGSSTIAHELEAAGICTSRGNPHWTSTQVLKILKNEKYVGDLIQKKTYTPDYLTHTKKINHGEEEQVVLRNHHEPLIDRRLWEAVQTELRRRNSHCRGGTSRREALSGKIICAECGAHFVARKKYRQDGSSIRYWSCASVAAGGRQACSVGVLLREETAEELIRQALCAVSMDRQWILQHTIALVTEAGTLEDRGSHEQLRQERELLWQKKDAALQAFLAGDITAEGLRQAAQEWEKVLHGSAAEVTNDPAELSRKMTAIVDMEDRSDIFLRRMVEQLVVYQNRHVELKLRNLPQIWTFQI